MPKILESPREKLIEEGKKILIEKSYADLNVREITKACNIAIGTFYNYFKNKDELVNQIFRTDFEKLINNIDKISETDVSLEHKLKVVYELIDEFLDKYLSIFLEITATRNNGSCTGNKGKKHTIDLLYDKVKVILDFHKAKGEIKNPLPTEKLSNLIVSNLVFLAKEKTLTFEELYLCLNL